MRLVRNDQRADPDLDKYDLIPKGEYDYAPKGRYVMGPADRFLLVPKNRYRLTLLPGQEATDELGVGWVTEENTPEGYDRLWGSSSAVTAYKDEGEGVRERMPHEIVGMVRERVLAAASVCDIGCGVGDLLAAAAAVNPQASLAGLDFSEAAVARARGRFPGAELRRHVIADTLPFETGRFDVVFCTDVMEHLEHRDRIAAELVRICAPGGTVVIVVPDGDVDQFFGHLWFFSAESLRAFLSPWDAEVQRLPDCREFMARIDKPAARG
jgi:SAM-dependent methyltransferase